MGRNKMLPTPESNSYALHLFFGKPKRRMLDLLPLTPYALLGDVCCIKDIEYLTFFYDLNPTRESLYPNKPTLLKWDDAAPVAFCLFGPQISQGSILLYIDKANPQDKRWVFVLDVMEKLYASTHKTASPVIETLASISQ